MRNVILSNEQGTAQGTMDIMEAHTGKGHLHKAFSAFVFRNSGEEVLVQQRSVQKMLFPLFWANTCCSHPLEDEDIVAAGQRRLEEECGFTCPLKEVTSFVYRAEDPGRGVEHEHDTILVGHLEEAVTLNPDPAEIENLEWTPVSQIQADLKSRPDRYAPWFHLAFPIVLNSLND